MVRLHNTKTDKIQLISATMSQTLEWTLNGTSLQLHTDGVGATAKRLAARTSLQRPYEAQIMTPLQLYEWASKNIPGVSFNYCGTEEYEEEKAYLEDRFEKAHTVTGTCKLHSYIPISKTTLRTTTFSFSSTFKVERVTAEKCGMVEDISGFVACACNRKWWIACVSEVTMTTLK